MKEKKKIPWGLIYVGLTVVVMIVFGLVNTEFAGMFSVIANLSLGFVALAVLMTGVFLVTEGGIIHMLLRAQGEHVGFWTTVKIGLIGIYYSYITPSSTGGQPAQVVYLRRDKVSVGNSTAVLFVKFFAYQLAFVLCTVASLIYMYPSLKRDDPQLIPIVLLGIAFVAWILKGSKPFLSKSFITNKAYMSILLLQFVFYFFNFACVPIYNVIGEQLYDMPLTTISLCLTLVYVVATIVGCVSGPAVNKLGRMKTLIVASVLMVVGFAGSAIFIEQGFWILTVLACMFIAGVTVVYTPIYDAASDALPVEENGRGVGILDLMMNTSASIGMAVYSSLIVNPSLAKGGLFGIGSGVAAQTSNVFWIMCAASVLALLLVLMFRKSFSAKRAE